MKRRLYEDLPRVGSTKETTHVGRGLDEGLFEEHNLKERKEKGSVSIGTCIPLLLRYVSFLGLGTSLNTSAKTGD